MKRSAVMKQAMLLCLGLAAPVWAADVVNKGQTPDQPANDKSAKPLSDKSAKPLPDKPAKPLPDKPAKPLPDKPGTARPATDRTSRITVPLAPTPEELQRQRQAQKQAADAREDPNRQGRGRLPTQVRNTLGPGNNVGANSNQARKDAIEDASGPNGARTPIP